MRNLWIILFICGSLAHAQDYSKKSYASIHMYAERLLGMKIMEHQEDVNFDQGKLYYYKTKDLEGNYVKVGGGYGPDYEMAMWKMDNGHDLVGVTSDNCAPVCSYECSFFEFTDSDSIEVTTEIFPLKKMVKHLRKTKRKFLKKNPDVKYDRSQFKFILPHNEGIVNVFFSSNLNQNEFPLLDLEWKGDKFRIQKKYKEIPVQ